MTISTFADQVWRPAAKPSPFDSDALTAWTFALNPSHPIPDKVKAADQEWSGQEPFHVVPMGNVYFVSFHKLARFHICFDSLTITAFDLAADTDEATLTHLLFDHIAPRILAHQGQLVLHGSAVVIEGKAALFLGETGTGKSTLAASLNKAGHLLLGDDAIMVSHRDDGYWAQPVYPSLRLNQDSVWAVIGPEAQTSTMAHYSEKRRVSVEPESGTGPWPLGSLFILSGDPDISVPAALRPSPAQACIWTLEQSFSLDPQDARHAARRLSKASHLIENVDAFLLDYPYEYNRLHEVHAMIYDHHRGCKAGEGMAD